MVTSRTEWTQRRRHRRENDKHVQSGAQRLAANVQGQAFWIPWKLEESGLEEEADCWFGVRNIGRFELVVWHTVTFVVHFGRGRVTKYIVMELVWIKQAEDKLGCASTKCTRSFPAFVGWI